MKILTNMKTLLGFACLLVLSTAAFAEVKVKMETSMGDIELSLDDKAAPRTVENFLSYTNKGFYDGTIFHRVISGFMIQGGGFNKEMQQKATQKPVINESNNGLTNQRGSIAMARTSQADSATSQFFINHANNGNLDGKRGKLGYAVFGKVISGMDVVDKIAAVKTGIQGGHRNVPVNPVIINKVSVIEQSDNQASTK